MISVITITGIGDHIQPVWLITFTGIRIGKADVEMSAIRPGDIVAFLQRLTARKAPFRDKTPPTHLRNFFQYLFKSGLTASNLALCVPSVAQRYDAWRPI